MSKERTIEMPLEDWVRAIAHEAAQAVIDAHVENCRITVVEDRVCKLERNWAWVLGVMCGCGAVGGVTGALVGRVIGFGGG